MPVPRMSPAGFASLVLSHQCGGEAQGCRWRLWRPSESGSSFNFIKRNSGSATLSILSVGEGAAWTTVAIAASEYTQRRLAYPEKEENIGEEIELAGENGQTGQSQESIVRVVKRFLPHPPSSPIL